MDIRREAARYYDLQPSPFEGMDIPFYIARLPSPQAHVLELGCGTGRVLVPLSSHVGFIQGIDISESMLAVCREKLAHLAVDPARARVEVGDISQLDLERSFDLILAPYRVFQNLESDAQIAGFFSTVRRHLKPGGTCILNVFQPWAEESRVRQIWAEKQPETLVWEHPLGAGRLLGFERIASVHPSKFICYPSLIYRYYEGETLKEEATLNIAMRCYSPDEFAALIQQHGFSLLERWGGYAGEIYGQGPELVIQFR